MGRIASIAAAMLKKLQYSQSLFEPIAHPPLTEVFVSSYLPPKPSSSLPEFIRLPKSGLRCPWTGLSRSALYELILPAQAPVKSVVLKRRAAKRGIRLIHLPSLVAYLDAHGVAQNGDSMASIESETQKAAHHTSPLT